MLNEHNQKELIKYWQVTAAHDYKTMEGLFKLKRYSDALFFGHIVLEKLLKSEVVRHTKENAPKIHDLARLAQLAGIEFDLETVGVLNVFNDFNIRCRYPEYKLEFYKKCNRKYAQKYLTQVKILYKQICLQKRPKK